MEGDGITQRYQQTMKGQRVTPWGTPGFRKAEDKESVKTVKVSRNRRRTPRDNDNLEIKERKFQETESCL